MVEDPEQGRPLRVGWLVAAAAVVAIVAVGITALLLRSGDGTTASTTGASAAPEPTVARDAPPTTADGSLTDGTMFATESAPLDGSATTGSVWSDATGEWTSVDVDADPSGVATDDSMVVVVGAAPAPNVGRPRSGRVLISRDGTDWSESHDLADELVSITRGPDLWVATAIDGSSGATSAYEADTAIYTSPDAVQWTRSATIPVRGDDYEELSYLSVAHGPNGYIAWAPECLGDSCRLFTFHSADAVTWEQGPANDFAGATISARDGLWQLVGSSGDDLSGYASYSGTSDNAMTWEVTATVPSTFALAAMAPSPIGWIGIVSDHSGSRVATRTWTSEDAVTWTEGATVDALLRDIVVIGGLT